MGQANAYYHAAAGRYGLTGFAIHGYKPSVQHSKSKAIETATRFTIAACTAIPPSHLAHLYSLKRKADLRFDHLLPGLAVPQSELDRLWMHNEDPEPLLIERENLSERRH